MKVRKFTGATSRAVLEKIREALGADAVIVSNRTTPDGIEIAAMPGAAFEGLVAAASSSQSSPAQRPASAAPIAQPADGDGDRHQSPISRPAPSARPANPASRADGPPPRVANTSQPAAPGRAAADTRGACDDRADEDVRVTLKSHVLCNAATAARDGAGAQQPDAQRSDAQRTAAQQPAVQRSADRVSDLQRSESRPFDSARAAPQQTAAARSAPPFAPQHADGHGPTMQASAASGRQTDTRRTDAAQSDHSPRFANVDAGLGQRLADEVAAMRAMLGEQMEQQAMTDAMKRSPLRARSLRELLAAGYSTALARSLVQNMPDDYTAARARAWMVTLLAHSLRCVRADDDLVTRGGVYALVGPTGVGKTTTTAKLAARCAVRYGASRLALLTTDSYRVGAHDQLRIYARILGVTVQTIGDRADLRQALDAARGKHLVLIDTVGMGQRDARLPEHGALLAEPEVQRVLLLNAATQAETLEEVVCRYGQEAAGEPQALAGTILTKLDEAARLGPALDIAIRHRLFLQGITNGQRVPEDFSAARADYLVGRSLRPAAKPSPFAFGPEELALLGAIPESAHA